MKKTLMMLALLFNALSFAAEPGDTKPNSCMETFVVSVTPEQANVIEELLTTMSETALFSLLFKRAYLRDLAKKLRPVSSTQFLGYVFERPYLIGYMKNILKSSTKWDSLTRSIVRGLKREAATTLFDDIPKFAEHAKVDAEELTSLARREDFNGFIVYMLEQY